MKEIGRRDSTKFTLLRLEEVFVSKFPSIFESRVEKVKAPPLSNRIEQPSSKSTTLPLSHAVSRIQYLNDFRSTLLTSTESTVAVERMERRNLLEPLPEPSTFFLRLFSSLSLSLGIYPLVFTVCIYGNWRGRGQLLSCRQCGPAATITDPLALLGTVVPGKTVRPVSSPPYLVSKRGATMRNRGTLKKGGVRGGSKNLSKSTLSGIGRCTSIRGGGNRERNEFEWII